MPEKKHIEYPIGFNIQSQKLINISDVINENKKDIICLDCNESFIAVRNHQTPHFKHKPNTKCEGNFETYIHWVTKEVFKEIKEIKIPEIEIKNLTSKQKEQLENKINNLIKSNLPLNRHSELKANLKQQMSESRVFKIEKLSIEKEYKTPLGKVRIDIVAKINKQELFIEPFYTSKIDELKKRKLTLLKKPTLSIDLLTFVKLNDFEYNLEDLKKYLISKYCKYWVFIRENKIEMYINKYLIYVSSEIKLIQDEINAEEAKHKRIKELENKVEKLEEKIRPTNEMIWKLKDEIIKIKKDLGISDYSLNLR